MQPDIHTIDLRYLGAPQCIASYIIMAPAGPVMIETGPGSTVPALVKGLADLGLTPADVRHTLVTHIHFDHAGASGWMASQGSQVYVHEFGAKHLIDPSKLVESARRIYKDRMDELWGELIPIPESQVTAVHDGDVLDLGGLKVSAIETPGHARHHHAFALATDQGTVCFTGDAAATYMPESDFVSVPTPPPEFDLATWIASVETLEASRFAAIYPTHFGRVDEPATHLSRVKSALHAHATFVRDLMEQGLEKDAIRDRYRDWFVDAAHAASVPEDKMGFYVKDSLADMNVTGILRYWKKSMEQTAT